MKDGIGKRTGGVRMVKSEETVVRLHRGGI